MRLSSCGIAIVACLLCGCDTEYDTETRPLSEDGGNLPGVSTNPINIGGSSGSADLAFASDSRNDLQTSYTVGETVEYYISIRNRGSVDVTENFTMTWEDDLGERQPATISEDIPAGETVVLDTFLSYGLNESEIGERTITITLDSEDEIDESVEGNNTVTFSFTVESADG